MTRMITFRVINFQILRSHFPFATLILATHGFLELQQALKQFLRVGSTERREYKRAIQVRETSPLQKSYEAAVIRRNARFNELWG